MNVKINYFFAIRSSKFIFYIFFSIDCVILPMYSINDDYEDISMNVNIISDSSSIDQNKIRNGRNSCAICGAKPTGINFDVLTVN